MSYSFGYKKSDGYWKSGEKGYGPWGPQPGGPVAPPAPFLLFDWVEADSGGTTTFLSKGVGSGTVGLEFTSAGFVDLGNVGPGGTKMLTGNAFPITVADNDPTWNGATFSSQYKANGGFTVAWWQEGTLATTARMVKHTGGGGDDGIYFFGSHTDQPYAHVLLWNPIKCQGGQTGVSLEETDFTGQHLCWYVHDHSGLVSGLAPSATNPRMNYYALDGDPLSPATVNATSAYKPYVAQNCTCPTPNTVNQTVGNCGWVTQDCSNCTAGGCGGSEVPGQWTNFSDSLVNFAIPGVPLGKVYYWDTVLSDAQRQFVFANPTWNG